MFFIEGDYYNPQRPQQEASGRSSLSYILNEEEKQRKLQQQRELLAASRCEPFPRAPSAFRHPLPSALSSSSLQPPPTLPVFPHRPQPLWPHLPSAPLTSYLDRAPQHPSFQPPAPMHVENEYNTLNHHNNKPVKIPLHSKGVEKKAQDPIPAHLKKAQRDTEALPVTKKNKKQERTAALEESDSLVHHIKALKEKAAGASNGIPRSSRTVASPAATSRPSSTDDAMLTVEKSWPFSNPGEEIAETRRNKQKVQELLDSPLALNDSYPLDAKMKQRERATPEQVAFLEKIFALDPLPSSSTRARVAEKLSMTPKRVQIWFQNKRARVKVDQKLTDRCNSLSAQSQEGNPDGSWSSSSWSSFFELEEKMREGGASSKRKTTGFFTFHNLARSDDGQLILRSEGAPSLILQPSLHKEKI